MPYYLIMNKDRLLNPSKDVVHLPPEKCPSALEMSFYRITASLAEPLPSHLATNRGALSCRNLSPVPFFSSYWNFNTQARIYHGMNSFRSCFRIARMLKMPADTCIYWETDPEDQLEFFRILVILKHLQILFIMSWYYEINSKSRAVYIIKPLIPVTCPYILMAFTFSYIVQWTEMK